MSPSDVKQIVDKFWLSQEIKAVNLYNSTEHPDFPIKAVAVTDAGNVVVEALEGSHAKDFVPDPPQPFNDEDRAVLYALFYYAGRK